MRTQLANRQGGSMVTDDMPWHWYDNYQRGRPGYPDGVTDIAGVPSSATVLELAAGTGKLTRLLASKFARVVAVEPDPALPGRHTFIGRDVAVRADGMHNMLQRVELREHLQKHVTHGRDPRVQLERPLRPPLVDGLGRHRRQPMSRDGRVQQREVWPGPGSNASVSSYPAGQRSQRFELTHGSMIYVAA
jgi:hypothetical protein